MLRIRDPESASKNLSILTQKIVYKLSETWSGSFIPDPDHDFLPIPDPAVLRIRIHIPQHCRNVELIQKKSLVYKFLVPPAWPTRRWMGYLPASSLAEPRHNPAILSLKKTSWLIDLSHVTDGLDLLSPNITMKKVPVWSPLLRSVHQNKARFILSGRLITMITNRHVYQLGNRWIGFSSLFVWLRWDHLKLQLVSLLRRLGIRLRGWTNLKCNLK